MLSAYWQTWKISRINTLRQLTTELGLLAARAATPKSEAPRQIPLTPRGWSRGLPPVVLLFFCLLVGWKVQHVWLWWMLEIWWKLQGSYLRLEWRLKHKRKISAQEYHSSWFMSNKSSTVVPAWLVLLRAHTQTQHEHCYLGSQGGSRMCHLCLETPPAFSP